MNKKYLKPKAMLGTNLRSIDEIIIPTKKTRKQEI